jgi:hypothetical protein
MDNLFFKSYIQQQEQPSQPQHHHHLYHHLNQTTNENSYQTPMSSQPFGYNTTQYTNMSFFNQHQQQTNPNYFYLNTSSNPSPQLVQSYTYHSIYPPTTNDLSSANQNHMNMYNSPNSSIKFNNKSGMEFHAPTLTSWSISNNESIADVTNIPKYTKPKINSKTSDERIFLLPPPSRLPPPPPSTSLLSSGVLSSTHQPPPPPTYEFITR